MKSNLGEPKDRQKEDLILKLLRKTKELVRDLNEEDQRG